MKIQRSPFNLLLFNSCQWLSHYIHKQFESTSCSTSRIYTNTFIPQPEAELLSNQTYSYKWPTKKINEMQNLLVTVEHVI